MFFCGLAFVSIDNYYPCYAKKISSPCSLSVSKPKGRTLPHYTYSLDKYVLFLYLTYLVKAILLLLVEVHPYPCMEGSTARPKAYALMPTCKTYRTCQGRRPCAFFPYRLAIFFLAVVIVIAITTLALYLLSLTIFTTMPAFFIFIG